ncbi:MAG: tetratricopeptide repeat protein [Natronosporangium sp.]
MADRFPDGQLYLNLRGYAVGSPLAPIEALAALLRSLGVPPEQIPTDEAQAAALYRTRLADRRMLVVLDNARAVDQVRPLLPGSAGSLVLVTSRDRLTGLVARDGACRITLDVLTQPEAHSLVARLLGEHRARAEPDALAELAEACAYLPLALRIAGANLVDRPGVSIEEYIGELRSGDLLTSLVADGDEESAVRGTLELSYRAIPEPARRTFRLLGLVPGPDVTVAAAAALIGTDETQTEPLLRQLASSHLLEQHVAGRYSFHDLLREYARNLAGAEDGEEDRAEAVHRLLDWYLHQSDRAARVLAPGILRLPVPSKRFPLEVATFGDPGDATAWLDAERDNLIAAVRRAADVGPRAFAWLLADALRGYLWHRGRKADWRTVANLSLAAAEHEGDLPAQTAIWVSLGDLFVSLGEYQQAIEHLRTALTFARRPAWPEAESTTIGKLGIAYWHLGALDQAAEMLSQSLALRRKIGGLLEQAIALGNLGNVLRELGRLQAAAEQYHQSAVIHREHHSRGEIIVLNNRAVAYHELGQLERALQFGSQALQMSRVHGSRHDEACALDSLAAAHRDVGHRVQALELAESALDLARRIGDRRTEADALNTLGSVQSKLGQIDHAIRSHERASAVAQRTGTRIAMVVAAIGCADAHSRLGSHDEAHRHLQVALTQARECQYRVLEGQALTVLARANLRRGQNDQAIEAVQGALASHRETGHRLGEANALVVAGHVARACGDGSEAGRSWRAARDLFEEVGAASPADLPIRDPRSP